MLRAKLLNNGAFGAGRLSGVVVVACLIFGWSHPAFSDEPTAAPDEQPHLQLAPIRLSRSFGGNIGYIFQRTAIGASKTTQQSLGVGVTAGIGIESFIWQPWLAQVSSNLLVGVNSTSTKSNTTPIYNSVNTSINSDAALNLLRSSRFPFEARIFRQDSRYAAFYSGTNFVSQLTGYSLTQNYISRNRRLHGNASFTSRKSGGPTISPSYADQFSFNLANQLTPYQSISISGSSSSEYQPDRGKRYLRDALEASHSYQPNPTFAVASMANLLNTNQSLTQGSRPTQQDFNTLQFNSFASLRPARSPLTMTSGVRFFRLGSSSNGILAPEMKGSNFNLGANYLFSPLLRMYGSVNVADSLGTQTVTTNAALTAAKGYGAATKTSTDFGGFRYSSSIGGSLSINNTSTSSTNSANQTTARNTQNLNLGAYLSHALDKNSELGAGHLATNLHQTVSTGVNLIDSSISLSNLNTSGSLSWSRAEGKGTTLLRLSATDSRNLRGTHQLFQIINLQASRSESISRNESLRGSLTVQATHQESAMQSFSFPNTITPSAEMNYTNLRAFKVKRLKFDSILRIADTNIAPGSQDQATRTWDNNFTYNIGRLNIKLNTHLATIGNTLASSIIFIMNRSF